MGKFAWAGTSMPNQPAQKFLEQLKDGYDAPLHECTQQDCVCVCFHAKVAWLVDQGGHVLGVF
jgi:hypothetical protein